jgi:predicted dehydrogenase/threonine dehydrogenase-like Zn-dependent dehydrogenase
MRQLTQNLKTGELLVEDVPVPIIKPGGLLVRNYFSLISAGTERAVVDLGQKSLMGKARERPDLVKKVIRQAKQTGLINTFKNVMDRIDTPVPLGYSSSGIIESVSAGSGDFRAGEMVACAGAKYANHAEFVFIPHNLCARIPEGVNPEYAAFTTVGSIALQGVRRAEPQLGDNVAVIGLGLVGQIAVQILKANGCSVLGIDIDPEKFDLAKKLAADEAFGTENAREACLDFSCGMGMDSVIITAATSSSDPVKLAGEISRDRGRVVVVGAVGMDVPRDIYYRKELDLRLSRSYGPGRYDDIYEEKGIDYPIGYVRWTEKRNMEEFLRLVARGSVKPGELITHIFDLEDATRAYDIIMGKTQEKYLAILLRYKNDSQLKRKIILNDSTAGKFSHTSSKNNVNIGVIGAGNFARGMILPKLQKIKTVKVKAIATATGLTAAHIGKKLGCDYIASDYHELLQDIELNAIIVATRNNTHSEIATEVLNSGKYVFVEKPLALSMEQINKIIEAWRSSGNKIMVGFNRRFSPIAKRVKEHFSNRTYPISINYRVNSRFISNDSWVKNLDESGGLIIAEICHFVDFFQYIIGCYPESIYAKALRNESQSLETSDNLSVVIGFTDGSVGTINYLTNGDPRLPKERVEIFGGGSVCIIDDFSRSEIIKDSKSRKFGSHQDKGHNSEFREFVNAVYNDKPIPVDFRESIAATIVTFKIIDSLRSGNIEELSMDY